MDRAALGPPAVRSNPQEMTHPIGPLGGIENSPARTSMCELGERTGGVCSPISVTQGHSELGGVVWRRQLCHEQLFNLSFYM